MMRGLCFEWCRTLLINIRAGVDHRDVALQLQAACRTPWINVSIQKARSENPIRNCLKRTGADSSTGRLLLKASLAPGHPP
jgi:hypothetical protein